jgi:hypothetical protein
MNRPINCTRVILRKVKRLAIVLTMAFLIIAAPGARAGLQEVFQHPPDSAKPWAYWFWMNGNISKAGITADLEAMARVGIGGVLIMEVARTNAMAPAGPVAFASPEWREMFRHVVAEAGRLGLKVNMNNDAGWCGSGGPWMTPESSMQKLVATNITVTGPQLFDGTLPQPKALHQYYRDLKVLAFPAPARGERASIPKEQVFDLTGRMDAAGKLKWEAPPGRWRVLRLGCTTTGAMNKPSPRSGEGLECDKLNPEAIRRHFEGFIAKLADDAGPMAGKVFTMTHIDSWEVGTQDWTPRMAEEFRARRGYELTPWLVVLAGGPSVGSPEETQRFRRDYKRTCSELNNEAYAGALRKLANRRGLKLSIEAYGSGGFLDPLAYAAEADLPMAEFWIGRWRAWHMLSPRLMASVAHVCGKPVVGAESFTSSPENDPFTEHPYSVKTLGDWVFCEGINRFVFHRNVLHPWTNLAPGMSFGGFGWHVDRNQTWWEPGAAYMQYLARCQAMLQQGQFVADVCRLVPDGENHGQGPAMLNLADQYESIPPGYGYDYISDKAFLEGLRVKNRRVVTPTGMSYRLVQLPNAKTLTPDLLRRLRDLVKTGGVIAGPRPERSPSLQNYPRCDEEVRTLATELWGDCDGTKIKEHRLGTGRVIWGRPMAEALHELACGTDFGFVIDPPMTEEAIMSITQDRGLQRGREQPRLMPTAGLNWIHRRAGQSEVYFVANPQHREVDALCTFRVKGLQPELWDPATGDIRKLALFRNTASGIQMPLHFDPAGSVFVVFQKKANPATQIVEVARAGVVLFGAERQTPAQLPEFWSDGPKTKMAGCEQGGYAVLYANGRREVFENPAHPAAVEINGPWAVQFQPGRGAPEQAAFAELADWSKHADPGVRYFSGTATYTIQFDWAPPAGCARWKLDLGDVKVMAEVKLNGQRVGVLWKPPYAADVTGLLKPGHNQLEVKVTNLWPNRLIGDEQYPDDCTPDGSWKKGSILAWPEWLLKGQPRPEPRRLTFTTWKYFAKESPLLSSGLLGPVTVQGERVVSTGRAQ